MAPSGKATKTIRRRNRKPARNYFKKKHHHPQNKQETFTSSCFSTSSKDSSKDSAVEVADSVCSTPKGHKFRIPEISTCPPAPKKPRVLTNCSLRRSLSFFAPPDLDVFFCLALQDASVSFVC